MSQLHRTLTGLIVVAALWLTGCAVHNVGADYTLDGKSDRGVAVTSLTRTGAVGFEMVVRLRSLDSGATSDVPLQDAATALDWTHVVYSGAVNDRGRSVADNPLGRLAVMELPAGNYEFFSFTGHTNNAQMTSMGFDLTGAPYSLKFTVRPGEVTYLGNLQIGLPEVIQPLHVKDQYRVQIRDMRERDLAVLKIRNPRLTENVQTRLIPGPPEPEVLALFIHGFMLGPRSDRM